jgi:hypothetical protein
MASADVVPNAPPLWTLVTASQCGRFAIKTDDTIKESPYVIWNTRQDTRMGEIPHWSSPFFGNQRSIVFVPQALPHTDPLVAASHKRSKVALFQLGE